MVRASLGSKAKLSVPKAPEIKGTAVEESYPMYAIPVKDFLQLKKWRPHQVCWRRERGLGTGNGPGRRLLHERCVAFPRI